MCRSIWGSRAAALIWGHPRYALPGWRANWRLSATIVEDKGNVPVALAETKSAGDPNAKYLKEIAETCSKEAELVIQTLEAGKIPLVLGGDHSIAVGTVSGVAEFYRRSKQRIGLLWIDAHSDINTPDSSPSGNVHGMPLGAIMGLFPGPLTDMFGFCPKVKPDNWCWWEFATSTTSSARTFAKPACTPSPCATSTSVACAP